MTVEALRLFNPEDFIGSLTPGLPVNVVRNAEVAARSRLFSMRRYSYSIGHPDEEHDVEFDSATNTWLECLGAMGFSVTAADIALNGARSYMSDKLGVGYFRFTQELTEVADRIAAEYIACYPPTKKPVILEPGY